MNELKFCKGQLLTAGTCNIVTAKSWTMSTLCSQTLILLHRYLQSQNLCGREPKQSFINASQTEVDKICSKDGRRKNTNLCMSSYPMDVYVISSTLGKVCSVQSILKQSEFVTVACDNVENPCRPVHFDKDADQLPGRRSCV